MYGRWGYFVPATWPEVLKFFPFGVQTSHSDFSILFIYFFYVILAWDVSGEAWSCGLSLVSAGDTRKEGSPRRRNWGRDSPASACAHRAPASWSLALARRRWRPLRCSQWRAAVTECFPSCFPFRVEKRRGLSTSLSVSVNRWSSSFQAAFLPGCLGEERGEENTSFAVWAAVRHLGPLFGNWLWSIKKKKPSNKSTSFFFSLFKIG